MERFIDERTGIEYERSGDYYLPLLQPPRSPNIGKYGRMRCSYLKEHHKSIYLSMLYSDTLCDHLEEIDQSANEMMELLVSQMSQAEGITEKLKAENQMRWVGLMNNIRNAAEEIVRNDLIYA